MIASACAPLLLSPKRADRPTRLTEPVTRQLMRTFDPRANALRVSALIEQRRRRLKLDGQAGQRVRQYVVDVASYPRLLLQARRAQLLLVRALGLGEQQLRLLSPHLHLPEFAPANAIAHHPAP